jgi:hypothetical protein
VCFQGTYTGKHGAYSATAIFKEMKFLVNQKDKKNIIINNIYLFWKAMPRIFSQARGKMRHNLSPFGQLGKTKRKRRPARKKKMTETLERGRGATFQLISNLAFPYKNQETPVVEIVHFL